MTDIHEEPLYLSALAALEHWEKKIREEERNRKPGAKAEKPLVYIASPYTKGDVGANVHSSVITAVNMLERGIAWPLVPLTSHLIHLIQPMSWATWLHYDEDVLLPRCDALLRTDALVYYRGEPQRNRYVQSESAGVDREVVRAQDLGLPVFNNVDAIYKWVEEEWTND